jgi:hypothetical protein
MSCRPFSVKREPGRVATGQRCGIAALPPREPPETTMHSWERTKVAHSHSLHWPFDTRSGGWVLCYYYTNSAVHGWGIGAWNWWEVLWVQLMGFFIRPTLRKFCLGVPTFEFAISGSLHLISRLNRKLTLSSWIFNRNVPRLMLCTLLCRRVK